MQGFNLAPINSLKIVKASLTDPEAIEAFSRIEFELQAWRMLRIVLLERLNQINTGIQHDGHLYIKFEDAASILR